MPKTIVLSEQGMRLSVKEGTFILMMEDKLVKDFKTHEVDQFVLMGKIELSSSAIALILKNGIDCVFMTLNGSFKGRLISSLSKNITLRVAQFQHLLNEKKAAQIARQIVAGKINNQRAILLRTQRKIQDEKMFNDLAKMRMQREKVLTLEDNEKIMGIEGEISNIYFSHFAKAMTNQAYTFSGRTRRPPKDPINACLSFGYALLLTIVEGSVLEVGLDPMMGALHKPYYGRPSLVLDLMEEWRSVIIDSLVLRLINRNQLIPTEFGPPDKKDEKEDLALEEEKIEAGGAAAVVDKSNAVYIKGNNRKVFISAFYARLREEMHYPPMDATISLRQIITQQIYHFAKVIKEEVPGYEPFCPR